MYNPREKGIAVRTLGIFAKEPEAGQVKSRLARETSPAWAARVADAFLRDTVERLAGIVAERILVFSPPAAARFFADLVRDRFRLLPQLEGDLGQRLHGFIHSQLEGGSSRVVVVGTDSPTLPLEYIEQAFRELERADVVFGPATDGGYYLLGCAGRVPPIFADMPWSSERVLSESIARLAGPSWRLAVLPPWYDVDTLADWWCLRGHVAALQSAGFDPRLSHTEPLLEGPISCV
jgi:rSAM/selenodomain-associated transferase 1